MASAWLYDMWKDLINKQLEYENQAFEHRGAVVWGGGNNASSIEAYDPTIGMSDADLRAYYRVKRHKEMLEMYPPVGDINITNNIDVYDELDDLDDEEEEY